MNLETNRVAVIGLGNGGSRVIGELVTNETLGEEVQLAIADTDPRTFESVSGVIQISLGSDWAGSQGCGGDAGLGEKAATASASDLQEFLRGAHLVIVVAGLGKGTGSGAARVIARLLRQTQTMAIFVVTLPFAFEGNYCGERAAKDLHVLRDLVDAVIPIPNDLLFGSMPPDTAAARAFEVVNSVLADGVSGLTRLGRAEAHLPIDFAAVRGLLKDRPSFCALGVGHGAGADRWQEVIRDFLACPFIGGAEALAKADGAILTLTGEAGLSVGEMTTCLSSLQQQCRPGARVMVGVYTDPKMQDEVQLTGLICRFAETRQEADAPPAPTRTASTGRKGKKKGANDDRQGELPLLEQALGIFSDSPPTTVGGENWDIPTFQRRGVCIDGGK